MSVPVAALRLNIKTWVPVDAGRQSTVRVASAPGLMSKVTGPATRWAPSHTSRIAPAARFVPTLWATTRTWASLFRTGSAANWMSPDEIARSGHVKSVKVRGRMLLSSFVSRIAPPSVTANRGGSTTAETGRPDPRAPVGSQGIGAVVVGVFGPSAGAAVVRLSTNARYRIEPLGAETGHVVEFAR